MVREKFSSNLTFEWEPEGNEGEIHVPVLGVQLQAVRTSTRTEAEACAAKLRGSGETRVARVKVREDI